MSAPMTVDRIRFLIGRFRERLWVRPLTVCLLSVAAAFAAKFADGTGLREWVPAVTADSVETLLSILSASMLVIATFAVASMVSAYASASSTATPRAFAVVVADDVSQNALSTFIGAFIFSIVSLTALKNEFFGEAGVFTLFVLTTVVFAVVILTFVRWVDAIARLGRVTTIVSKVERATAAAMERLRDRPRLGGVAVPPGDPRGAPVYPAEVGYVQHIDMAVLQADAEAAGVRVTVACRPGAFVGPRQPLAHVRSDDGAGEPSGEVLEAVGRAFLLGESRTFDSDPRFGFVVLSEIAGRALSPAVNDPGTAIHILGVYERLFALWCERDEDTSVQEDRVEVPELSLQGLLDDAYDSIGRDGAGSIEVAVRLQQSLAAVRRIGHAELSEAALENARRALQRAERALDLDADLETVRAAAAL